MSASDVRQKIIMTETALKEAGQEAVNNAIIDALKEIARTLENQEKSAIGETKPQPSTKAYLPETPGRMFRSDE